MMTAITPIIMPKWGLSMKEGTVTAWLVEVGTAITVGMPILEVETDKIANAMEATDAGLLRRKVAAEGDLLPVKALLGVMADASVSEAQIDAFIAAWVTPAADEQTEQAASLYQFLTVDGIAVRYVQRGAQQGTPVLFLHGFGGDLDNWLFNIDALAEHYPVIALDLPGHGQSGVALPGPRLQDLALFVQHFLQALNVSAVHVVGHSLGGALGARLALDDPDRVQSLTLISSAGFGPDIDPGYIQGFIQARSRRDLKPVLERLFADAGLVSRAMVDNVLKYKRLDGVDALLSQLGERLFPQGVQQEQPGLALEHTSQPLLLLWGQEDRVIPVAHAAHAPPRARVKIFAHTGHMAQMEQAAEVNRLILEHLACLAHG